MSLCVIAGGQTTVMAVAAFTLAWTHSVEKTGWRESWAITPAGLELREAAVRGSGAGMDPGEGARLDDGWWVWVPNLPPQPHILLAASGATVSGWTLCAGGRCETLGRTAGGPIELLPCAG